MRRLTPNLPDTAFLTVSAKLAYDGEHAPLTNPHHLHRRRRFGPRRRRRAATPTAGAAGPLPTPPLALAIMLGAFMVTLDMTMVNVALDTLARTFATSVTTIQWVATGYLLALAVSIPMTGWAIERFGARNSWVASLLMFIGGSVLCGLAWSSGSLIAFRVLQGFGGGMLIPLTQTILAQAAGPNRLGRVMAVVGIPAMLGPVLGPVLGGVIVTDLSWRVMFYINVPVTSRPWLAAYRVAMPGSSRHL